MLTLLLRPDGSLDPAYADSSPTDRLAHNVPFILLHHLNHPRCVSANEKPHLMLWCTEDCCLNQSHRHRASYSQTCYKMAFVMVTLQLLPCKVILLT